MKNMDYFANSLITIKDIKGFAKTLVNFMIKTKIANMQYIG